MEKKEAIKILKDFHDESALFSIRTALETLYPEFKKSEDERIIKILQEGVNDVLQDQFCTNRGVSKEKVLAWLEKQGEQKPTIEMKSAEESLGIDSDTYNEIVDECIYSEQKSQRMISAEAKEAMYDKPVSAWSEEDGKIFDRICDLIHSAAYENYDVDEDGKELGEYAKIINWFKFLKDRYTWKPSDEQMHALHDLNLTGNISYAGQGQVLIGLYNDLKKLREE